MLERRKANRYKLFQLVKLEYGGSDLLWTEGIDISDKGILCEAESGCIETDQDVKLLFSIGEETTIEAEGFVARIDDDLDNNRCYLGIEFSDLDEKDREIIQSYVQDNYIEM
jgi:c-di-GMP-binding flagellar brake protein YcgR